MMGDGVADIKAIRAAMYAVGYTGLSEVEIFSANNWWKREPDVVLDTMIERFHNIADLPNKDKFTSEYT